MKKILSAFAALLAITACYNGNEQKAETATTTDGKAIVENIMTRTSIRQYTDQTISADTIETLLRAGMAAPTAVNKQPWHFVAITSKDKMKPENVSYNEFGARLNNRKVTHAGVLGCGQLGIEIDIQRVAPHAHLGYRETNFVGSLLIRHDGILAVVTSDGDSSYLPITNMASTNRTIGIRVTSQRILHITAPAKCAPTLG